MGAPSSVESIRGGADHVDDTMDPATGLRPPVFAGSLDGRFKRTYESIMERTAAARRYDAPGAEPAPAETGAAVLAAARALFAERGFEGASVRAITDTAGANLGAVTYHFGSKESLYVEVLRTAISPLRDRVYEAVVRERTPIDRVAAIMRAFFEHFRDNPDVPLLMLQRIAAGQPPPGPVGDTAAATTVSAAP
jgi:AcrR family transcriptional regulator